MAKIDPPEPRAPGHTGSKRPAGDEPRTGGPAPIGDTGAGGLPADEGAGDLASGEGGAFEVPARPGDLAKDD